MFCDFCVMKAGPIAAGALAAGPIAAGALGVGALGVDLVNFFIPFYPYQKLSFY